MEWTGKRIGRLFELYERHFEQLRSDVIATNRSLGSLSPERTWLEPLTRNQFEALLADQTADPEITRLWVRRIIRGHEKEFPELQDLTHSRRQGRKSTRQSPPDGRRRATGT